MHRATLALLWTWALALPSFGAQSVFDSQQSIWTISNGRIQAVFQLTPEGYFLTQSLTDLTNGDRWNSPSERPVTAVHLQVGADVFDASRQYVLQDQLLQPLTNPSGIRQYITLQDVASGARIVVILEVFDNQPVLQYRVRYYNPGSAPVYVTSVDMLPWAFSDDGKRYTAFRVNQWSAGVMLEDFGQVQSLLTTDGTPVTIYSGALGQQCGWVAVRDTDDRGLFAGWEFDGRTMTTVRHAGSRQYVSLASSIQDLHHPVAPGATFTTPSAFIGLFHGDFDEAGYRTQRFVEAVLAKPTPDVANFPYVSWDSWAYGDQIDEATLRKNAEIAASLGVELFVVDLGWARSIGDWYADPLKFPSGLDALADYVHSLGMKFGLHFALAEAAAASPVLQANPDWTSTEDDNYFGADSLCLSHQPTRDWLIQQGIRMIDDYHVDWILQDGQNMIKQCTKTTHTHDPADSNYSNAVDGLNYVVSQIQAARPNVLWENCENGGNMMTFNMVKNYVTSITNDASGALDSRNAAYGVTYPFPPRYAERYMPDSDGLNAYATHSYRFGGPWVLMNQLAALNPDQAGFLKQQIANYKQQRAGIAAAKVYHILPPAPGGTDAIQSYNPATDSAIGVIARAASDGPEYIFRPQGLIPDQQYTVWFEIAPMVYSLPGKQLMSSGVRVQLPTPFSSDVVHIEHQ